MTFRPFWLIALVLLPPSAHATGEFGEFFRCAIRMSKAALRVVFGDKERSRYLRQVSVYGQKTVDAARRMPGPEGEFYREVLFLNVARPKDRFESRTDTFGVGSIVRLPDGGLVRVTKITPAIAVEVQTITSTGFLKARPLENSEILDAKPAPLSDFETAQQTAQAAHQQRIADGQREVEVQVGIAGPKQRDLSEFRKGKPDRDNPKPKEKPGREAAASEERVPVAFQVPENLRPSMEKVGMDLSKVILMAEAEPNPNPLAAELARIAPELRLLEGSEMSDAAVQSIRARALGVLGKLSEPASVTVTIEDFGDLSHAKTIAGFYRKHLPNAQPPLDVTVVKDEGKRIQLRVTGPSALTLLQAEGGLHKVAYWRDGVGGRERRVHTNEVRVSVSQGDQPTDGARPVSFRRNYRLHEREVTDLSG